MEDRDRPLGGRFRRRARGRSRRRDATPEEGRGDALNLGLDLEVVEVVEVVKAVETVETGGIRVERLIRRAHRGTSNRAHRRCELQGFVLEDFGGVEALIGRLIGVVCLVAS